MCRCDECKLHRYLVFAGAHYYPEGGWDDFLVGSSDAALAREAALS